MAGAGEGFVEEFAFGAEGGGVEGKVEFGLQEVAVGVAQEGVFADG